MYPPNGYPPPGSGQPPNAAPPQFAGYDQWNRPIDQYGQLLGPPPAAAPPPAAPPPYAAPPPGYPAPGVPYAAPPPPFAGPPAGGGSVAFGELSWSSGFPPGNQYVVRIEDIEARVSGNNNEMLAFTATTMQPAGSVAAGVKGTWTYTLTERAIGKLGRDVVNAGIDGTRRYPRGSREMAAALLQELRGVLVVVRSEEQKDGNGVNTSIVSRYNQGGGAAPAPQVPPGPPVPPPAAAPPPFAAPPPAAPPPVGGPPISFPASPPAGTGGFGSV